MLIISCNGFLAVSEGTQLPPCVKNKWIVKVLICCSSRKLLCWCRKPLGWKRGNDIRHTLFDSLWPAWSRKVMLPLRSITWSSLIDITCHSVGSRVVFKDFIYDMTTMIWAFQCCRSQHLTLRQSPRSPETVEWKVNTLVRLQSHSPVCSCEDASGMNSGREMCPEKTQPKQPEMKVKQIGLSLLCEEGSHLRRL